MNTETQVQQLEAAIRKQAETLANSHLRDAQQQRQTILAEATKRLRLREDRELDSVKTAAEQEYRRRVQASEIKMQTELDQLRWNLIQLVMLELRQQLKQLSHQPVAYEALLQQYLTNAANFLEEEEIIVEVNAQDHALLSGKWEEWVKTIPTKRCMLTVSAQHFSGGMLVRNKEDRRRVDNTFEGLIERLEHKLYQVITAQLFASVMPTRNV